nr:hypothetical protein GCM10017547_12780 [Pseudarthrobacter oxydans]
MVKAGQAHRHVQRAAAHVGFNSRGALDNVNKAFANNSEHGHTLPERGQPTAVRDDVRAGRRGQCRAPSGSVVLQAWKGTVSPALVGAHTKGPA